MMRYVRTPVLENFNLTCDPLGIFQKVIKEKGGNIFFQCQIVICSGISIENFSKTLAKSKKIDYE